MATGQGVEWVGDQDERTASDGRGWPILRASDSCDGANPMTGRPCTLGHHAGYHRDTLGAEWLDEE